MKAVAATQLRQDAENRLIRAEDSPGSADVICKGLTLLFKLFRQDRAEPT